MSRTQFTEIESWAVPKFAGTLSFFETIAVSDLENKEIRLDAKTQRAVIGFPVFGKQPFRVNSDGGITVSKSVAFGRDSEERTYTPRELDYARMHNLKLVPHTTGPGIFAGLPKESH